MVLTASQKEIQRKRKIAEAEAKRMADIGTAKRSGKDRLELARARSKETDPIKQPILKEGKLTTGREEIKQQIAKAPEEIGLQKPGEEVIAPESVEVITEGEKPVQELDPVTGQPLLSGGVSSAEGLVSDVALLAAGGIVAKTGWKVGTKLFSGGKRAIQAGTAAKNTAAAKPLLGKIAAYAIGGYAALKTGESLISYFTGRKIDEQQQALNTLGQITSTIVGDSKTSAGDFDKGLQELRFIKSEVLRLEGAIKAGTIQSAAIKFNGKIYDINADIYDQLATIDEGIRDLQDFALLGKFPELSEFEIQQLLRELEAEGAVKSVDLTTARRLTE